MEGVVELVEFLEFVELVALVEPVADSEESMPPPGESVPCHGLSPSTSSSTEAVSRDDSIPGLTHETKVCTRRNKRFVCQSRVFMLIRTVCVCKECTC